jgi:hypothetical protein
MADASDELLALDAVVDGTATPEQQALVDASPELTSMAHDLVAIRQAMPEVEVPAGAREAAIAAALDAFDAQAPAPAVATGVMADVVPMRARRAWYRPIMAAAAAAVVVVAGVATLLAVRGGSGGDSDDVSMSSKARDSAATAPTAATEGTVGPLAASTVVPAAADATEMAASATTAASGAGSPESSAPPATIGSIGPGGATLDLTDESAVRQYAATATPVPDVAPRCGAPDAEQLGQVSYQGRAVMLTRDPSSGDLSLYAVDDCSLVTTITG